MSDISQVKLPDGTTYNLKDSYVRTNYRTLSNNDFDTINVTELNAGDVIVTGGARFLNTINGDISGNSATATSATSATKATQDESGNNIKSTYANAISISDHTITLKNKNGTSLGTVTVPDNNTTYTVATGTANGKIKVTPSSSNAYEVSVYGLKSAAYKDVTDTYSATGTDPVSGKAVKAAIDGLPSPMVFRGTVGAAAQNPTVTSLPVDGTAIVGDTYKVITNGTYGGKASKVGDTLICLTKTSSANTWEIVPSGDEPSGTVTSVAISNGGGLSVSGSPITSSGTITISHADTSSQASVNNSGRTYIQDITLDTYGHVTGIASATETVVNTDRYVNSAAFADATSADANNPVKMTLTRAGSDTASVTAYIPKVSSSSAGVAPKGAAVSSQSQTTKFLREDGTWAAPSYTTNTNTTYSLSASGESVVLSGSDNSSKSVSLGNQLLPNLPTWTANPTDDVYLIRRDTAGGNAYGQVKFSTVWNYIKGKADNAYVDVTGDTMTGALITPKTKIANTCYGVSFGRTNDTPKETIFKTGIKWVSGSHMPVIHITGYAYGLASPVEFKIGFYIYGGKVGWSGACNMGAWEPELRLFKYTRDSVDYVAVGFVGTCYFLQLQADVQDEMGKLANVVLDDANWSWEFYTDTGHIPAADDGTTCCSVSYKANILNGIRNVSINGNYLRVNNNGTNTDLTIPYATSATNANQLTKVATLDTTDKLNAFTGSALRYASVNSGIVTSTDGLVMTIPWSDKYGQQIFFNDDSYLMKHRYHNNGTWSDWKSLIDESNINDYAPTKSGTGASGTWGISISGNATSATTASKLGSSNVGSATQPIYLSSGTATACTYTLGKSVPSDAKFTDTTYTAGTGLTLSDKQFSVSSANASTIMNLLSTGSSAPTDNDYYIAQYAGGGTSTTTYHRRPHSVLWSYIKAKADTTYVNITGDTMSGNLAVTNVLGIAQTAGNVGGISLYGGTGQVDTYGIAFRLTSNKEKHGYVQGDWATYFTMNSGATTRGWVFRTNTTNGNVASISGGGNAVFNGSVTVGGNTTNTSGVRQVYNSTTKSLDFVFVA